MRSLQILSVCNAIGSECENVNKEKAFTSGQELDYLESELHLHILAQRTERPAHKSHINLHLHGHSLFNAPRPPPNSFGEGLSADVIFGKCSYVTCLCVSLFWCFNYHRHHVGLDPALPLYTFQSKKQRLSPSDAAFVDIIHTDGGVLGMPFPMGHADFFPNGGVGLQPGCVEQNLVKQQWLGVFSECYSLAFATFPDRY